MLTLTLYIRNRFEVSIGLSINQKQWSKCFERNGWLGIPGVWITWITKNPF